jgi:hypothetical protein
MQACGLGPLAGTFPVKVSVLEAIQGRVYPGFDPGNDPMLIA